MSTNILCVDQYSNLGGGQRSLLDLLPAFSHNHWRLSVALPGHGPLAAMLRNDGYVVGEFSSGDYDKTTKPVVQLIRYACEIPRLASFLNRMVRREQADLLYVNGPRLLPPAALVARRTGLPLIFHCHNRLFQSSAILLAGEALRLAKGRVIACCEYAAEPLAKYLPAENLSIVYNGVNEMPPAAPRLQNKIRRIGVVGRVESEKGQLAFVQAARLVVRDFPDCRFTVVGSPMFSSADYYRQVRAASEGLPIDFVDWRNDVSTVFSNLDLLVVPSSALEATTRVILEAYSAGLPVVAFPSGGIPEILHNGQTGFLTRDSTVEALADRIASVLRMNPDTVDHVVARARQDWVARFTLDAYRAAVCRIVSRALTLPPSEAMQASLQLHQTRRHGE